MAPVLDAEIIELAKDGSTSVEISEFDLIGFGAGIAFSKHYKQLLTFAQGLQNVEGKKAFVFSTAGLSSEKQKKKHHNRLLEILNEKGFQIVGQFACKGHDSYSVLKVIGGINKGRPNADDLSKAKAFAKEL